MKAEELVGRTVTVRVRQDHINRGEPRSANRCAVALAIQELLDDDNVQISVCYSEVVLRRISPGFVPVCHALATRRMTRFISRFDRDGTATQPVTVRLTFRAGGLW